ncbi:MAG: hypothetical protein LIV29_04935 [Denitrobacterium sp.]|jgi:hypothetical protein|nr:hypothetical protein [Denitrobacterium sp.]MCI1480097.1 hypothetical protein [Eggerthellaceae bacterium]
MVDETTGAVAAATARDAAASAPVTDAHTPHYTEEEILQKFFADNEEEAAESEEEIDDLIEAQEAAEEEEARKPPFRDVATEDEMVDATRKVFDSQGNFRAIFYQLLDAARTEHAGAALSDFVANLPEMKLVTYPTTYFIESLYDAGALDRALPADYVPRTAAPVDAEAFFKEGTGAEGDPDLAPAAGAQPAAADAAEADAEADTLPPALTDYDYTVSPAGERILSDFSPLRRIAELFDVEPDLVGGFKAVLEFCQDAGRSREEIEEVLKEKGFHIGLDLDSSFYLDRLEQQGGLVWKNKGWHTTAAGVEILQQSERE